MQQIEAKNYDVMVVGSGIVGSAMAWALAQEPGLNMAWIKGPPHDPNMATRAAGAMLGAWGEMTIDESLDHPDVLFRLKARQFYDRWLENLENQWGRTCARLSSTVVMGKSDHPSDLKGLNHLCAMMQGHQWPHERVKGKDVKDFHPLVEPDLWQGVLIENEWGLSTSHLLTALHDVVQAQRRVDIFFHRIACGWQAQKRLWQLTDERGQIYQAPHLVMCAGVHSLALLPREMWPENQPSLMMGKGWRAVLNESPLAPDVVIRHVHRPQECCLHMMRFGHQPLYLGATNVICHHYSPLENQDEQLHQDLMMRAKHQLHENIDQGSQPLWLLGLRPLTPSHTPLMGRTPLEGLFLATATYRNGVLLAPMMAAHVVDEIMGRVNADGENHPYGLMCLSEKKGGKSCLF